MHRGATLRSGLEGSNNISVFVRVAIIYTRRYGARHRASAGTRIGGFPQPTPKLVSISSPRPRSQDVFSHNKRLFPERDNMTSLAFSVPTIARHSRGARRWSKHEGRLKRGEGRSRLSKPVDRQPRGFHSPHRCRVSVGPTNFCQTVNGLSCDAFLFY